MTRAFTEACNDILDILVPSINVWDHKPPVLDLVSAKFLHIPLLRRLGGETEVDRDKGQAGQHGLVDQLAWWSG